MAGVLLENAVEVRYRGPATLEEAGNSSLRDRAEGVDGMVWEALQGAGWVGEITSPRMTVAIRVGVAPAPRSEQPRMVTETSHYHEGGWVDADGVTWQQRVGPLNGRAAGPGFRLVESEFAAHAHGLGNALLRAAALQAGWHDADPDRTVELPEVQIAVSVARRNPRWEDPDAHPQDHHSQSADTLDDSELLSLALEVAARFGDSSPTQVRHARGTRFDVTRATGSKVFSDTPSCIFAMQGNFRWNHSRPANPNRQLTEQDTSYQFMTFVLDAETGKLLDVGASHQAPDLRLLSNVITDNLPRSDR
jgi:hypothetical protein